MSTDNPYPGIDASLEDREAWEDRENAKYADLDKVLTTRKMMDLDIDGGTVDVPTAEDWEHNKIVYPLPRFVCSYDTRQRPDTEWRRRLVRKFQGSPLRVEFRNAEYRWRSDGFVVTLHVYDR